MTTVIRQCTSDDAGLIRSLGMTTFRDTFAADNSRENMDDYLRHPFSPELVKSQLSEPESVFMLASVGGTPAAYMQLNTGKAQTEQFGDTSMEIERLYVLSDFKRPGTGHHAGQSGLRTSQEPESEQNLVGRMGAQRTRSTFLPSHGLQADRQAYIHPGSRHSNRLDYDRNGQLMATSVQTRGTGCRCRNRRYQASSNPKHQTRRSFIHTTVM